MGEWDGIKPDFIPQCAVCNQVNGKGCKAFNVEQRDEKYYDRRNPHYTKCEHFDFNENASQSKLYKELNENESTVK